MTFNVEVDSSLIFEICSFSLLSLYLFYKFYNTKSVLELSPVIKGELFALETISSLVGVLTGVISVSCVRIDD